MKLASKQFYQAINKNLPESTFINKNQFLQKNKLDQQKNQLRFFFKSKSTFYYCNTWISTFMPHDRACKNRTLPLTYRKVGQVFLSSKAFCLIWKFYKNKGAKWETKFRILCSFLRSGIAIDGSRCTWKVSSSFPLAFDFWVSHNALEEEHHLLFLDFVAKLRNLRIFQYLDRQRKTSFEPANTSVQLLPHDSGENFTMKLTSNQFHDVKLSSYVHFPQTFLSLLRLWETKTTFSDIQHLRTWGISKHFEFRNKSNKVYVRGLVKFFRWRSTSGLHTMPRKRSISCCCSTLWQIYGTCVFFNLWTAGGKTVLNLTTQAFNYYLTFLK